MNKLQKQLEKLASEKQMLQRERTDLQRQCSEMTVAVEKLNKEKVCLQLGMCHKSLCIVASARVSSVVSYWAAPLHHARIGVIQFAEEVDTWCWAFVLLQHDDSNMDIVAGAA